MKANTPTDLLIDRIRELHGMEAQIATSMVVLSGSVMNLQLRKALSDCAWRARHRRDELARHLIHYQVSPDGVVYVSMQEVFSAGNRLLAGVGNPYQRDVMMVGHCLRIERLATAAYEICSGLSDRAGFTSEASLLSGYLSELGTSCNLLQTLESELCRNAAKHRFLRGTATEDQVIRKAAPLMNRDAIPAT